MGDWQQFEARDGHAPLPHASPATQLLVTASEMSATFIKRKVSKDMGATTQPIITASGGTKSQQLSSQEEVTVLCLDNLTCRWEVRGGQLDHHPAENQNAIIAGVPWALDSIPPVCSLFLCLYYCLLSMRTVILVVEGRAGKRHKGWGRGSHGGGVGQTKNLATPGNQPGPWETQHQAQLTQSS